MQLEAEVRVSAHGGGKLTIESRSYDMPNELGVVLFFDVSGSIAARVVPVTR